MNTNYERLKSIFVEPIINDLVANRGWAIKDIGKKVILSKGQVPVGKQEKVYKLFPPEGSTWESICEQRKNCSMCWLRLKIKKNILIIPTCIMEAFLEND